MLRFGLNGGGFVDGGGPQGALFLQQLFGLLLVLAAVGLQEFVERGGVALGAGQFAGRDAEPLREGRVHVVRAEQIGVGGEVAGDFVLTPERPVETGDEIFGIPCLLSHSYAGIKIHN